MDKIWWASLHINNIPLLFSSWCFILVGRLGKIQEKLSIYSTHLSPLLNSSSTTQLKRGNAHNLSLFYQVISFIFAFILLSLHLFSFFFVFLGKCAHTFVPFLLFIRWTHNEVPLDVAFHASELWNLGFAGILW